MKFNPAPAPPRSPSWVQTDGQRLPWRGGTPLKQFFSFFGSKVGLSRHYPPPAFGTVIEPFAGSAGYACRYPDEEVLLYDIDPCIVRIWEFLIRATRQDVLSLPLMPVDVFKLSQAERDFIGFWWRRSDNRPAKKPGPWALSGKYAESFWSERTRLRIGNQVERVNHWKIKLASYKDIPVVAGTWFVDPPYQLAGKKYTFGSKLIDYTSLAEWVKSLPGQRIVCEGPGADWLPFRALYTSEAINYKDGGSRTVMEMVWP
jgi:hypothetical protein